MSLEIVERRIQDVVVLDVMGRLTLADHSDRLSEIVLRSLRDGRRGFLLHLRDVSECDTTGITSLVVCLTHVRAQDGALALVAVPARVRQLLETGGLWSTFETFVEVPVASAHVAQRLSQRMGIDEGEAR